MEDAPSPTNEFLLKTIPPASKWLTECIAKHPSCDKKARHSTVFCTDNSLLISDLEGEGLMATRLLTFSLHPTTEGEDRVRLALSESLSADTQYVALSHRWGTGETCCTERQNLDDMVQNGILTSQLPATFRDAVHVTRGLGFSHIWVDSLCIIQDDKEDWKREAQRMAIIYDNAVCTIAAMDGLDSDAGLVNQTPEHKSVGVLDSRAWVCQERMISPRSLMFTSGSVSWECRKCDASLEHPELKERRTDHADEIPTHPKDIFTFFRDWRMPAPEPKSQSQSSDSDQSSEESIAESSDGEGETDGGVRQQDEDVDSNDMASEQGDKGESEVASDFNQDQEGKRKKELVDYSNSPDAESTDAVDQTEVEDDVAYDSDGYPAYQGGGLPGHAHNLSIFLEGGRQSKAYSMHPEGPNEDGSDPFGDFMVFVTNLNRPRQIYYRFLQTWWRFISVYSPLSLTYGSDKFLAMNGISTVAQRWSHLRSSFGLFWHFSDLEMLWYVDPKGPPGARPETWLVPTWSWASTRNGRIINDVYRRMPMLPLTMIKPQMQVGMGTAFDQPLPFVAWKARRYHAIEMKGDLRKGVVKATQNKDGVTKFEVTLDKVGRFSDEEVYDFRPDCVEEFPVGSSVNVLYMVWHHYDARAWDLEEHIDVGLVFKQMKGKSEITVYEEEVSKTSTSEQRLLTRLGYLETTYPRVSIRTNPDIMGELNWYFVRLA
ncbi:heterokaryon incompatibility protein [Colletotrichum truncatum]|uniref:Heterokaryon incompatibility protein n=1 Tax=Colletotrichum truncatum TaxID=5467 RepID=A0ACC3YXE6_COLTU|nr:heterokaryon incompatibility protein [Colletotrichum truncatum]KAF6791135.1 heterokaryon incompatibility protein [Colletotrichum truncatum]